MAAPWETQAPTLAPWETAPDSSQEGDVDKSSPLLQALDVGGRRGAADLAGFPGSMWNLAQQGVRHVVGKFADLNDPDVAKFLDMQLGTPTQYTPDHFKQQAAAGGLPMQVQDPTSAAQRYLADAGEGIVGGAPGGVGGMAAGALGTILPQAVKDNGGSASLQGAASLAGALAPAAGKYGLQKVLGINPETAATNIANANAVGAQPTLGLAAGPGSNAQTVEKMVSGIPGGAGIMAGSINKANAAAGQTIEDVATNLGAAGATDQATGAAVQGALGGTPVAGQQNYLGQIRSRVDAAYAARDAAVPQGTMVDVKPFMDRVTALSKNDPAFEQYIKTDPVFARIQQDLETANSGDSNSKLIALPGGKYARVGPDGSAQVVNEAPSAAGTQIPYQDAAIAQKALSQLVDYSYMHGATTSQINGSLAQAAKAMGAAVDSTVSTIPGAKALAQRANGIWQEGEDAKAHIGGILAATTGEKAYNALMAGSEQGNTILDSVYRGLSVPQQNMVTGGVIQKLGVAGAGVQGADGAKWSSNTFLTNYNKLSDGAKDTLFRNLPQEYRTQLDQFAKYADNVKQSNAIYANPSGTASASTLMALGGTAATGVGMIASGQRAHGAMVVAGALSPIVASTLTAKAMTNPGVVRWLAASTKLPVSSAPIVASQLMAIGKSQNLPDVVSAAQQLTQSK